MSITLDLPEDLENELAAEAARLGLSLSEYAVRILATARPGSTGLENGAQLVDYWQSERLIGSRPDITDGQDHARRLRRRAERRTWE